MHLGPRFIALIIIIINNTGRTKPLFEEIIQPHKQKQEPSTFRQQYQLPSYYYTLQIEYTSHGRALGLLKANEAKVNETTSFTCAIVAVPFIGLHSTRYIYQIM